ncbi:MFS transporter [Vibrio sp. SCSIO 43136]|uniref:MFS transporter n=1 Tax=Vibrio sp. SCSIO 43136 TaxID=2819101 RepID=UPI0020764250|nr:MFS transporter [Vibrio sp. SCSIO 43136]USD63973.1 MFS transporter [Vibrio sp. SCSIO 43136]
MIEPNTASYRKTTLTLAFGSFLIFCNLYVFQPILPILAQSYNVSALQVNWLQASGTFTLAFSLVPWAILSEQIGRRAVMMVSLFLIPIVGLALLQADSIVTLSLVRGLMGIALGGFAAVAVAYIAEEYSPKAIGLAVGVYVSANSLGGIAGRVFGGVITDFFNWQTAITILAIVSFIGAVIVLFNLPKQTRFQPQAGRWYYHNRNLVSLFRQPTLMAAMWIGGINFALFVNLYSVSGFRLIEAPFNYPVSVASLIFLCYLSGTFTSRLSGHWTNKHSYTSGLILGGIISFLGLLIGSIDSIISVIVSLLLISGGAFFVHSLAYAWVGKTAPQHKATATALYLVHYYVGGSLGGFWLLYCWQQEGWIGVCAGAGVLYLALFALIFKLKQLTTNTLQQAHTNPDLR